MFRDSLDADVKRKEITWIAILCLFVLAAWQFVATFLGGAADFSPRSYEEKILFAGLGAILLCSVLYIAVREREQRLLNQRLLANLREAIARLNERLRQLYSLCSTSAELIGTLEANRICRLTVEALARELETAECSLSFFRPGHGNLEFTVQAPRLSASEGLRLTAQFDSQFSDFKPQISAPLRVNEETVGSLTAARLAGQGEFSPEENSLLVTFANMAAKALESARLHEELKESYLSSLRTLMGLLGARDNYTASHAQRVAALACRLAEKVGLPEEFLRLLEEFAPLHDLGKVCISDDILLKVGPLSAAQRKTCERHAPIGEEILRPLRPDPRALEMVRSHHERWDGKGYPDGLAGEQIPLLARILHIADAYDALLSERPYSAGIRPNEALAEIRLATGRDFDPLLVETFVAMLQEEGVISPLDEQASFLKAASSAQAQGLSEEEAHLAEDFAPVLSQQMPVRE